MTLAYGGRMLSSVITLTGSSQAIVTTPSLAQLGTITAAAPQTQTTSSASPAVPFFAAQQRGGPPALGPIQAGLTLLTILGASHRGVLLLCFPQLAAAVPAHS